MMAYKGMMLTGLPNMAFTVGYTNASWTLKADLVSEFVCRLSSITWTTTASSEWSLSTPAMRSKSGRSWISLRATCCAPSTSCRRAGHVAPWRLKQNYFLDIQMIRRGKVDDDALHFTKQPCAGGRFGLEHQPAATTTMPSSSL